VTNKQSFNKFLRGIKIELLPIESNRTLLPSRAIQRFRTSDIAIISYADDAQEKNDVHSLSKRGSVRKARSHLVEKTTNEKRNPHWRRKTPPRKRFSATEIFIRASNERTRDPKQRAMKTAREERQERAEMRGYLDVHTRVHRGDISSDKHANNRPALTMAEGEGDARGTWAIEGSKLGSRSDSPVIAPLNRNTAAIRSRFPLSPLSASRCFPSCFFAPFAEETRTFLSPFRAHRLETCTPSVNLDANASLSGLQIESGLATCLS